MRLARGLEPLFAGALAFHYLLPGIGVEDLSAASRKGVEACGLEARQHFLDRVPCQPGNEEYLCRGECLYRDLRKFSLDAFHHLFVIVEPQLWVESSNNVELGGTHLLHRYPGAGDYLLCRQRVGVIFVALSVKGAERAAGRANIGVIE